MAKSHGYIPSLLSFIIELHNIIKLAINAIKIEK